MTNEDSVAARVSRLLHDSIGVGSMHEVGIWKTVSHTEPRLLLKNPVRRGPQRRLDVANHSSHGSLSGRTKSINSVYMITHNLDGDDSDVWPWLGESSKEAKENNDVVYTRAGRFHTSPG